MRTLLSCFPFYYYYLPFANKSHVLSGRLEPIDRVLFDVSGMGRMFGRRNRWPLMMFSSQMTCKKRKRTCLGGREGHPAWCPNKSRKPKTMVCRWEAEEGRGSGRAVFCVLRRCPCWSKRRWERHTEGRPILPWLRNAKFRTLAKMSSTKPTDCGSHTLDYRWWLPKKATRSHTDAHDSPLHSFISRQINFKLFIFQRESPPSAESEKCVNKFSKWMN